MIKPFVKLQVLMATRNSKKGQSLAEYGLILALIAVVCIAALTFLGGQISTAINNIANSLSAALSG